MFVGACGARRALRDIFDEHSGLQDRFLTAGRVTPDLARRLGLAGLAGRASGQPYDLRVDHPVGWVEGWRGEVLVAVEADEDGRIAHAHAHDPSWHNWPAIEHAVMGNIVPDFPLINKSFNLSYSGVDG